MGKEARPSALTRSTLFDKLKAKLVTAVAAQPLASSSDSQESPAEPDDPMAALAEVKTSPTKKTKILVNSREGYHHRDRYACVGPLGEPKRQRAADGEPPGLEH